MTPLMFSFTDGYIAQFLGKARETGKMSRLPSWKPSPQAFLQTWMMIDRARSELGFGIGDSKIQLSRKTKEPRFVLWNNRRGREREREKSEKKCERKPLISVFKLEQWDKFSGFFFFEKFSGF